MMKIDTFVSATTHTKEVVDGEGNKTVKRFIRIRFNAGNGEWLTAFNPKGVAGVQWVQRVSRATGKTRTQTRWPVTVRFTRDSVVGSDVVKAELAPRDFTPTAIAAADAADLAALDGVAPVAAPVAAAPAGDGDDEDDE